MYISLLLPCYKHILNCSALQGCSMAQSDWHQVGVPKDLSKRITDLMENGVIVGFTRPAQFYAYAAQMEIRRVLDDLKFERALIESETPPPLEDQSSEAGPDGSERAPVNDH